MERKLAYSVIIIAVLLGNSPMAAYGPFPGTVPGTEIGGGLSANFEPSGGAWHSRLNQLFVCGDDGRIARLNRDGAATANWSLAGNWEGIAVADPATDFVFVVNENTAHVREFNFVSGTGARDFNLTAATPGPGIPALTPADIEALVDSGDGRGAEALTFVPDPGDPEGGLFFVGSQENGYIYRFRLSLASGTDVVYMGKFKTWPDGDTDLSGLEYDSLHGVLLAVWDGSNVLRALTPAGLILQEWSLPAGSNDEEGLGYDGLSLFIAEDPAPASEVWRYDDFHPMGAPALFIDDIKAGEGDFGGTDATFAVSLSAADGHPVTVHWATADDSAGAPADYISGSGDLSFTPGQITTTITVRVNGDTVDEPDETFTVSLSGPAGATIDDAVGVGLIVDNDPNPVYDLNLDGQGDAADLQLLADHLAGSLELPPCGASCADVNGDGKTDARDLAELLLATLEP